MLTVKLGPHEVTPVGLGTLPFGGPGPVARATVEPLDQARVTGIVRAALDGGITWFDTAEAYGMGHAEHVLTTALHACGIAPGEVTIATKWLPAGRTASHLGRSVDDRLACLQGYPIGLYQIHDPITSLSGLPAQLRAMAALLHRGAIQAVGVSNFSARQMELAHTVLAAEGAVLTSNQVQISLLRRDIERNGLLETANGLGVTLIAYSPLASGVLTGRFHRDPAAAARLRPVRRIAHRRRLSAAGLARTAPLIEALQRVADTHGVTVAQVAIAWLVAHYRGTVLPVPGASSPGQAAQAAGAGSVRLTPGDIALLEELSRSSG